ncbi:putative membrane-associated kinase regulator [Trema orientale]|uniref:Putative membrane-associated kinase regulator n=1 Tax=Trema orientale TaxID=63057 RepID=A0A2P5FGN0_TREOI|nr:putative membrane-associated kinase regulator [Trema orientale]
MEALNFLKFWKPTTFGPVLEVDNEVEEEEEEEEEDSFFDLELTTPDFDQKEKNPDEKATRETESLDLQEEKASVPAKTPSSRELCYPKPSISPSPIDSISKRKILPLEPINPKPQSPIALLKSAPTFRVFTFKKSKSRRTETTEKTREAMSFVDNRKQLRPEGKLLTVRFSFEEEASNVSRLTRESSSRRTGTTKRQDHTSDDTKTEQRFSKDVIQKYLKLVKPLYVKVSKRCSEKTTTPSPAADFFMASPASSTAMTASTASPKDRPVNNFPAGIRTVCKHLGKSKSSSSAAAASTAQPPANRRDDSLLQQHDGIQSAILHCKRSFNSSRDSFSLSRSTSDSSSMKSCSSDSYRLSNSASETSHDFSARSSIEEGRGVNI